VTGAGGRPEGFAPVAGTKFRLLARPKPGWSGVVDCEVLEVSEPSLLRSVPSGSYLVLSDGTNAVNGPAAEDAQRGYNLSGAAPYCLRSPGQLALILDGLDLVEPGLVSCSRWRPEPAPSGLQAEVGEFCAVGRKP